MASMNIDVILGADGQVVGVHVNGTGTTFVLEEPYVHSMPIESGWTVRRYTGTDELLCAEHGGIGYCSPLCPGARTSDA